MAPGCRYIVAPFRVYCGSKPVSPRTQAADPTGRSRLPASWPALLGRLPDGLRRAFVVPNGFDLQGVGDEHTPWLSTRESGRFWTGLEWPCRAAERRSDRRSRPCICPWDGAALCFVRGPGFPGPSLAAIAHPPAVRRVGRGRFHHGQLGPFPRRQARAIHASIR